MPESITPSSNPEALIRVFSIHGRMIRHWTYVAYSPQGIVIDWDGRTDQGGVAPTGWYIFDIGLKNWPGFSSLRFKMLRIRGAPSATYDWDWN